MVEDPKLVFVAGTMTLRELAEQFKGQAGCSFDRLRHRSAKEKWTCLRRKYRRDLARRSGSTSGDIDAAVCVAEVPQAPPPNPELAARLVRDADERAAELVAEKVAKAVAPQAAALEARLLALDESHVATAELLEGDAQMLACGSKIKLVEEGGESVALVQRDFERAKLTAATLHARSVATKVSLRHARVDEAHVARLEAEVALLKARLAGSLPAEKVTIVFREQVAGMFDLLKRRMSADAYRELLEAARDEFATQRATATTTTTH